MSQIVEKIELGQLNDNSAGSPIVQKDMSLVSHVKVDVSVEIGTASISIQELFSLKEGTVLSLVESIEDLLKLKVDGRIVALGELVAVDDCFALKIRKIVG